MNFIPLRFSGMPGLYGCGVYSSQYFNDLNYHNDTQSGNDQHTNDKYILISCVVVTNDRQIIFDGKNMYEFS